MHRIALAVVCLLAWARVLPAQTPEDSRALERQAECEKARSILAETRPTREQSSWAYGRIVVCGDLAPNAIASGLLNASAGSPADSFAFNAAWSLSDRRLLEAVRLLARNTSTPAAKRMDAIVLLGRYVSPEQFLRPEGVDDSFGMVVGIISDGEPFSGTEPITFADRVRAMDTIRRVGVNDPNRRVRRFAKLAAQQLNFSSGPGP